MGFRGVFQRHYPINDRVDLAFRKEVEQDDQIIGQGLIGLDGVKSGASAVGQNIPKLNLQKINGDVAAFSRSGIIEAIGDQCAAFF